MRTIPSDALLPSEYQQLAQRTEASARDKLQLTSEMMVRLIHAGAGLVTEAGEFWDVLKRSIFYGQPLDEEKRRHLAEEIGDGLWYYALACNALSIDLGEVMAANVRKLRARFPEKFDADLAKEENRDRGAEREAAQNVRRFEYDGGQETAFDDLNATPGAPAPEAKVSFNGKVCETCGGPAVRCVYDRSPDGKHVKEYWCCYKHARKAVQVGNFS